MSPFNTEPLRLFPATFRIFPVGKWAYTCFTLEKAREVVGRPEI